MFFNVDNVGDEQMPSGRLFGTVGEVHLRVKQRLVIVQIRYPDAY